MTAQNAEKYVIVTVILPGQCSTLKATNNDQSWPLITAA